MTPAQHRFEFLLKRYRLGREAFTREGEGFGYRRHLRRSPAMIRARDRIAYALRHGPTPDLCFSYPEIAEAIGYDSHSAAMQSVRREAARLAAQPGFVAGREPQAGIGAPHIGTPHAGV